MKESADPLEIVVWPDMLNINFMMIIDSTQASPVDSQSDFDNVIDE